MNPTLWFRAQEDRSQTGKMLQPKRQRLTMKYIWTAATEMHSEAAAVPSTSLPRLAVSKLSQSCVLHMKQDVGLDPLGEFTSSRLPPEHKRPLQLEATHPQQRAAGGGGAPPRSGGGRREGNFGSQRGSSAHRGYCRKPKLPKRPTHFSLTEINKNNG